VDNRPALLERVRVAADAHQAATAPHADRIQKMMAVTTDPGYAAARAPLVAQLASETELAIFDGLMVVFRNSSFRVSHEFLADWLAAQAARVGEEKAVEQLEQYLREPEFECMTFAAVAGVEVADETRFASDLVLSGPEALPDYAREQDPFSIMDWHRRPTAASDADALSGANACPGKRSTIPRSRGTPGRECSDR
jgi:hypothetical protein